MRFSLVICLGVLLAMAGGTLAQEATPGQGLRLSPDATQQLQQQQQDDTPLAEYREDQIRDLGGGRGEGVSYHTNDVFVGTFRRSVSPYNGKIRPWVLEQGVYAKRSGERLVGRFHFFHNDWGEHDSVMETSSAPLDGVYFLVGSLIPAAGAPRPGIYRSDVQTTGVHHFVPADEGYLAQFERRYQGQVNAFKQAQARAAQDDGLSFGQVLALGLGAAVLGAADIPSADAVEIGGAFVSDVLTQGQSDALGSVADSQRDRAAAAAGSGAASPSAAPAAGAGYSNETVTLSCPGGASSSVPLQYKTQDCRSAMIAYWKAYACNQIGDIASATQQCKAACGNAQCRE